MLKPLLLAGAMVVVAVPVGTHAMAPAYNQVQYSQYGAGYRGPPTDSRDYNYQPFTQTPTYYYNNQGGYAQPGYGYPEPAYGYEEPRYEYSQRYASPTYGYGSPTYSYEQNLRERRAFAANQEDFGQSSYGDAYSSGGRATWRDSYGRSCYWENRSEPGLTYSQVQICR